MSHLDDSWRDGYGDWKLASPYDEHEEPCEHRFAEVDILDGVFRCGCGEAWAATPAEVEAEIAHQAAYFEQEERELRRRWWRELFAEVAAALTRAQKGLPPDLESDAKVAREPDGSDAECMLPSDGATCKAWQAHSHLAGDEERWHGCTVIGSSYEEQFSETGKRRHRPLRLDFGGREFGADLGFGDWRPGAAPG